MYAKPFRNIKTNSIIFLFLFFCFAVGNSKSLKQIINLSDYKIIFLTLLNWSLFEYSSAWGTWLNFNIIPLIFLISFHYSTQLIQRFLSIFFLETKQDSFVHAIWCIAECRISTKSIYIVKHNKLIFWIDYDTNI
jgi:hypothetical protein